MSVRDDCLQAAIRAGASPFDAERIVDGLAEQKKLLKAAGKEVSLERAIAKQVLAQADDARKKALMQRRHAALNIIKREQLDSFIRTVKQEGGSLGDALDALLVGSHQRFSGSRESASRLRSSYRALWGGSLANDLEKVGSAELLKRDKAFSEAVTREMIEPNSTGDAKARATADIFSRTLENIRQNLNRAGAGIGKMETYAPQSHDSLKIQRAGEAVWVDFVSERLDWERSFPDVFTGKEVHERRVLLEEVFYNIVTGKNRESKAAKTSVFTPPRNLASSFGKERVLHFKDADAALSYHRQYGQGTIVHAVLGHLDKAAGKLGLMDIFGPNPDAMIQNTLEQEAHTLRLERRDPGEVQKLWSGHRDGRIAHYYAALAGETGSPVNLTGARISSTVRGITSMAKLGGAFLSSFADVFVKATALRHSGAHWLESWQQGLHISLERLQPEEKKVFGRQLGVYTQGLLGDLYSRFDISDAHSGTMTRWMNAFFKLSGLEGWTEGHKAAYTFHLSSRLADNVGKSFTDLNPDYAVTLRRNGLESRWGLLQKMVEKAEDGMSYVLPEKAHALSDADVAAFLPTRFQQVPATGNATLWQALRTAELDKVRRKLALDVMGYFADETSYAILEPDAKSRAFMYGVSQPGTLNGELRRFMLQFKSYPIVYAQRILREKRWQRASAQSDASGLVQFALSAMAMGYVSMVAKDVSKGREPRSLDKKETYIAALLQSGGLGIMGDFFLGTADRFGSQAAGTLLGPVPTTFSRTLPISGQLARGEFQAAGEDALRLALDNTPFINLWYTRAALDYLVLFHIREAFSPGTLARSERKIKKEYNQSYLKVGTVDLTPSKVVQRGGGFQ